MALKTKKAAVDTNVLVSAFVYPAGTVREIFSLAMNRKVILAVSEPVLAEYAEVLRRKFGWAEHEIDENVRFIRKFTEMAVPSSGIKAVKADPTDDKVIECAVAAGADFIVSGDKHLLNISKYKSIKIVKPADFLRILNG